MMPPKGSGAPLMRAMAGTSVNPPEGSLMEKDTGSHRPDGALNCENETALLAVTFQKFSPDSSTPMSISIHCDVCFLLRILQVTLGMARPSRPIPMKGSPQSR